MRFEFKPSFDRSVKSLTPPQKVDLVSACVSFLELLEARSPIPSGIGLKRLQGDYWELRKGISTRILFRWRDDLIENVLAGNHDSIKNFLKNS